MASRTGVRSKFRKLVFERDDYTCVVCSSKRPASLLNAHHIMDRHFFDNGGYVLENGITVCEEKCHMILEQYHISNGQTWTIHPDEIYQKIGSSLELAYRKDLENG